MNIVVETPRGSTCKYNYEPEQRMFKLKKILPAGMIFPFDFGFIPGTKGEDGDPLDAIIISELKTFPGCLMECRITGCITAKQTEKRITVRNDRFIAIPEVSLLFSHIKELSDLPAEVVRQLETFFINYNELEGKKFKPLKRMNAQQSLKLIKTI